MSQESSGPLRLHVAIEQWPRVTPMRITGYTFPMTQVVTVTLERDGLRGLGEAAGVYYHGDTIQSLAASIESARRQIEAGISHESLPAILQRTGARNAVDCALWDLEAKLTGQPVWRLLRLPPPRPLVTTFTCHADSPEAIAARARGYRNARAIKLKLTGEPVDADRVRAVREAVPDAWLAVDANQGFTPGSLAKLLPVLVEARVALIEQPFAIGQDHLLDGLQSPIPIAADESAQSIADLASLAGRYAVVNIKLDKCGGLTEALAMERAARQCGLSSMVGNMGGTSLAMAPAFLVGQSCSVVDLDGPAFLENDRPAAVEYVDGHIHVSETTWGGSTPTP